MTVGPSSGSSLPAVVGGCTTWTVVVSPCVEHASHWSNASSRVSVHPLTVCIVPRYLLTVVLVVLATVACAALCCVPPSLCVVLYSVDCRRGTVLGVQ